MDPEQRSYIIALSCDDCGKACDCSRIAGVKATPLAKPTEDESPRSPKRRSRLLVGAVPSGEQQVVLLARGARAGHREIAKRYREGALESAPSDVVREARARRLR